MIFVAVGTTDFDALVERMDEIAPFLSEEVVMQIGNGQYIPRNCQYFRFAPSLEPYYHSSTVVISHGGLGIVTEALEREKRLVVIENTTCQGGHQRDLICTLAGEGYLVWCRDLDELPEVLGRVRDQEFRRYVAPECRIHEVIKEFLQSWM